MKFQLSLRTMLEIMAAVAVVLALIVATRYSAGSSEAGRYQLDADTHRILLLDTRTGQVWVASYGGWSPLIRPMSQK